MEIRRVIPDLQPNKRYIVKVRATNKLGVASDWSDAIVVETNNDLSTETPEIQITSGVKSMLLQWTAITDNDFDHYKIHVSDTEGFTAADANLYSTPRAGTLTNITRYHDGAEWQPLEAGGTYYVQMYWTDTDGVDTQIGEETSSQTKYSTGSLEAVETIAADAITAGSLTAGIIITGSIATATSGPRLVMDSEGIRGYDLDGESVNLNYDNATGDVFLRGTVYANRFTGLESSDIVLNGDFETDLTYWTAGTNTTLVRTTSQFYNGIASAKVTATSGATTTRITYDRQPCDPGSTFEGSFAFKQDSGLTNAAMSMQFYDENGDACFRMNGDVYGQFPFVLTYGTPDGTNWTEGTVPEFSRLLAIAPPDAVEYELYLTFDGSANFSNYVDYVILTQYPAIENVRFSGKIYKTYTYAQPTEIPGGMVTYDFQAGTDVTDGTSTELLLCESDPIYWEEGRLYRISFSCKSAASDDDAAAFSLKIRNIDELLLTTTSEIKERKIQGRSGDEQNIDTLGYYSPDGSNYGHIRVVAYKTSAGAGPTLTVRGPRVVVVEDIGSSNVAIP